MRMYLAGAENPSWRSMLVDGGAKAVSLNFNVLRRRLPKHKDYLLSERYPTEIDIALEAGDLSKRALSDDELDTWAEDFHRLVEVNEARLEVVTEIDAYTERERVIENRELFWKHIPAFLPMWRQELGYDDLEEQLVGWDGVALAAADLEGDNRVRSILQRHLNAGARIHVIGLGDPESLMRMPMTSASTTAWTAPTRYGDTVFWDGQRLRRYPAAYKEEVRRRYRSRMEAAGFDTEKVEAGDADELTRMAIWSFLQMEANVGKIRREPWAGEGIEDEIVDIEPLNHPSPFSQSPQGAVDTGPQQARNNEPRERRLLPLMGMNLERTVEVDEEGIEHEVEKPVVEAAGGRSVLACDSCHLASLCPEASPGASCAFEIPVSLRTAEDMSRFLSGILEMQGKRVLFARFAEELEGGLPTPETSKEVDRLFRLVEQFKEIQDNREFVRMSVEARGQSGVLSRIFGSRVGEAQGHLDQPIDARALSSRVMGVEAS